MVASQEEEGFPDQRDVVGTSDGGDGEGSVLFSETLKDKDEGTSQNDRERGQQADEEDEEEVAEDGEGIEGEYLAEDPDHRAMEESHESADMAEPPHWLMDPQIFQQQSPRSRMRSAELRAPKLIPAEEYMCDEEGDMLFDDTQSYHSGNSDEYEMDHRPILERTAVKKDIEDFVRPLDEMWAESEDMGEPVCIRKYHVVDRLGEGMHSVLMLDRIAYGSNRDILIGVSR
jgi:hypothetical protein